MSSHYFENIEINNNIKGNNFISCVEGSVTNNIYTKKLTTDNGILLNGTFSGLNEISVGSITNVNFIKSDYATFTDASLTYIHSSSGSFTNLYGNASNLSGISAKSLTDGNSYIDVTDTGSNGTIKFTTENVERMRIASDGKTGIGNNNPDRKLDISESSGLAQLRLTFTAGAQYTDFTTDGGSNLLVNTAGSITLDADKGVTTFKDNTVEYIKFTNNAGDCIINNGSTGKNIIFNDVDGTTIATFNGSNKSIVADIVSFATITDNVSSLSGGIFMGLKEVISNTITDGTLILTSGSLTKGLTVDAIVGSFTTLYGDGSNLTGISSEGSTKSITAGNSFVDVTDTGSNGTIKFTTENVERMRIASDGKTGIGNNNPDRKLDISESSGLAQLRLTFTAGAQYTDFTTDGGSNLLVNTAGSITLDADKGVTTFKDNTVEYIKFTNNAGDCIINNGSTGKNIIFNDVDGTTIATFNGSNKSIVSNIINSTTITDNVSSLSGGLFTGLKEMTSNTISDGTLTITSGSLTKGLTVDAIVGSFTTLYGDGSNLTGVSSGSNKSLTDGNTFVDITDSGSGIIKFTVDTVEQGRIDATTGLTMQNASISGVFKSFSITDNVATLTGGIFTGLKELSSSSLSDGTIIITNGSLTKGLTVDAIVGSFTTLYGDGSNLTGVSSGSNKSLTDGNTFVDITDSGSGIIKFTVDTVEQGRIDATTGLTMQNASISGVFKSFSITDNVATLTGGIFTGLKELSSSSLSDGTIIITNGSLTKGLTVDAIVGSFTTLYGDGSNLTGVSGGGSGKSITAGNSFVDVTDSGSGIIKFTIDAVEQGRIDGTTGLTMQNASISGVFKSFSITDNVATLTGGIFTGLKELNSSSISDGTIIITNGSLTGGLTVDSVVGSFTTLYGDGSNLTNINNDVITDITNKNVSFTSGGTNFGDYTDTGTKKAIYQLNATLSTGTYYIFGDWTTNFVNNPLNNQKIELLYFETDPSISAYTGDVSTGTVTKTFNTFQKNNNTNNFSFSLEVPSSKTYYLVWARSSTEIFLWGTGSSNLNEESYNINYINPNDSAVINTKTLSYDESNSGTRYGTYLTTNSPAYYILTELNFSLSSGYHYIYVDWMTEFIDSPLGEQFLELHYKNTLLQPSAYATSISGTTLFKQLSSFKSGKNNSNASLVINVPDNEIYYFVVKRYSNNHYLWGTNSAQLKSEDVNINIVRPSNIIESSNKIISGSSNITVDGSGTLSMTTNASERITIDNSGNVGIGITTPSNKLEIVGITKSSSFTDGVGSLSGGIFLGLKSISSSTITDGTTILKAGSLTNALTVDAVVGSFTTLYGNGANLSGISVSTKSITDGNTFVDVTDSGSGIIKFTVDTVEQGRIDGTTGLTLLSASISGNLKSFSITDNVATLTGGIFTGLNELTSTTITDGTAILKVGSLTNALTVDAVVGSFTTLYGNGSNLSGISVSNKSITEGNSFVEVTDTGSDGHVKFTTEGVERMVINSSGYIGIGETTPEYPLEVRGNVSIDPTGNAESVYYANNSTWNTGVSGPYNITIYSETNVAASSYVAFSDTRIKTNIKDIPNENIFDKIKLLEPKTYQMIDKVRYSNRTNVGFIAQQVKKAIPEAVSINKDFIPNFYQKCSLINDQNGIVINVIDDINFYSLKSKNDEFYVDDNGNPSSDEYGNKHFRIKIIDNINKEYVLETENVIDNKTLKIKYDDISKNLVSNDNYFIYGQEINDFHILDKDVIFTYVTAGLQELRKQQEIDKITIQKQQNEIHDLYNKYNNLLDQLSS